MFVMERAIRSIVNVAKRASAKTNLWMPIPDQIRCSSTSHSTGNDKPAAESSSSYPLDVDEISNIFLNAEDKSKTQSHRHVVVRSSFDPPLHRLFFRGLLEKKSFQDDPHLLVMALQSVTFGNRTEEFVHLFPIWWKHVQANLDRYDVETICTCIEKLGLINEKSTGYLSRTMKVGPMQLLVARVCQTDGFDQLSNRVMNKLFMGLNRFCLGESNERGLIFTDELLNLTSKWFANQNAPNAAASADDRQNFYHTVHTCSSISKYLVLHGRHVPEEFINSYIRVCQPFFDAHLHLVNNKLPFFDDFGKVLLVYNKFGQTFMDWKLDPKSHVLNIWLSSAENLLHHYTRHERAQIAAKPVDVDTILSADRVNRGLTDLCSLLLRISGKYRKIEEFQRMKSIWSRTLRVVIEDKTRLDNLYIFVTALHEVDDNSDVKKVLESKLGEDDSSLDELWSLILRKEDDVYKVRSKSFKLGRKEWSPIDQRQAKTFAPASASTLRARTSNVDRRSRNFDEEMHEKFSDDDDDSGRGKSKVTWRNNDVQSERSFRRLDDFELFDRRQGNTRKSGAEEKHERFSDDDDDDDDNVGRATSKATWRKGDVPSDRSFGRSGDFERFDRRHGNSRRRGAEEMREKFSDDEDDIGRATSKATWRKGDVSSERSFGRLGDFERLDRRQGNSRRRGAEEIHEKFSDEDDDDRGDTSKASWQKGNLLSERSSGRLDDFERFDRRQGDTRRRGGRK